jgi:hypothetical protein
MAQTLVDELLEMMPELEAVGGWQVVGKPRRRDEYGRAAERSIAEEVLCDCEEDIDASHD